MVALFLLITSLSILWVVTILPLRNVYQSKTVSFKVTEIRWQSRIITGINFVEILIITINVFVSCRKLYGRVLIHVVRLCKCNL